MSEIKQSTNPQGTFVGFLTGGTPLKDQLETIIAQEEQPPKEEDGSNAQLELL